MEIYKIKNSKKISVVMPVFNGRMYLESAIKSILNQTFQDYEFLIVNDGSTDDSVSFIRSFDDPRIRLIDRSNNLGLAATRNEGVNESQGEYIAMLDCDDIANPTRLEEQNKFLDNHPDFGLVGSWVKIFGDEGIVKSRISRFECDPDKIPSYLLFNNVFAQSSVMLRKSMLPMSPYRENFPPAEDYDLWVRIASKFRVGNLPKVLVNYRIHPDCVSLRKAEAMEISVQRNIKHQLKRLGLTPSREEMRIHRLVGNGVAGSLLDFDLAEGWLLRILEANSVKGVYQKDALREIVGEKWLTFCINSSKYEAKAFRIWRKSQLQKYIPIKPHYFIKFIRVFK